MLIDFVMFFRYLLERSVYNTFDMHSHTSLHNLQLIDSSTTLGGFNSHFWQPYEDVTFRWNVTIQYYRVMQAFIRIRRFVGEARGTFSIKLNQVLHNTCSEIVTFTSFMFLRNTRKLFAFRRYIQRGDRE